MLPILRAAGLFPPAGWKISVSDALTAQGDAFSSALLFRACPATICCFFTMPNVQVILKEKIASLGAEADIVTVRAGYARNFLVPQGKAYEANPGNLRHINNLKARRAERETAERAEAQNTAGRLRKTPVKLTLEIGQGGKAFGAITAADIAEAVADQLKVKIDRHQIDLEKPIKTTGKHEVTVRVHPDVEAVLKLNVTVPEAEEATESADAE
jgi:large subunit ribosomal protein L9